MVVKGTAKEALAVNTCIAENWGCSRNEFVVYPNEKVNGSFKATATLSRASIRVRDEKASKESVAHLVPVEQNVGEYETIGCKKGDDMRLEMNKLKK